MADIKTTGDLRRFLSTAMQDLRAGNLEHEKAGQIARLAAQINTSIHSEIAARVHLKMKGGTDFNTLVIVEAALPEPLPNKSNGHKPLMDFSKDNLNVRN